MWKAVRLLHITTDLIPRQRGIFHVRGRFYSTLVAGLLGAACAGSPANETPDDSLRVALLTPGPFSDQAWNGETYRGLVAVKDSPIAAISQFQTRTPALFDED